jgi:HEPN domain-containing protein
MREMAGFIRDMAAIKKGATRGTVFALIAEMRLKDAQVLLEQRRYHGSLYLAGYSVECALKWAITRRMESILLPAHLEIHDLQKLLLESGLFPQLREDTTVSPLFSALVDDWGPQGRYAAGKLDAKSANRLYNQIKQVYQWLIEQVV